MKTREQLIKMRNDILSDERVSYRSATIFENAPLALHQLAQEVKLHLIEDILEIEKTDFKKLRK